MPASIDDVVGADARALDLQVAADARPEVGDPVAVLERRVAGRIAGAGRAAQHRDQVLVVGAVELVRVGERAGLAAVVRDPVLRRTLGRASAARLRRPARCRGPGMITTRSLLPDCVHGGLDRVEAAALEEPAVEVQQRAAFGGADRLARLRGAQDVAGGLGVCDRPLQRASASRAGRRRASCLRFGRAADASERAVGTCAAGARRAPSSPAPGRASRRRARRARTPARRSADSRSARW